MEELKLFNKKINKVGFEILLNIQIISFLKPNLIQKYLKFLEDNLKSSNESKLFIYLDNYWIKKYGWESINYYNFINSIKDKKYLIIIIIN